MRSSGFDDDWTLLLLISEVFSNVFNIQARVSSLPTEYDIVFIDEYP